ncbi:MAG: Gfo/Idh/MocA family oxidoreductase [Anaerolineales bacterium]|nr:Gfo/Idh/MocA family oxidoreductase [Anaerolineales bacterium]
MRIGILSFAHLHAEAYIGNLRATPGVEMIGIADENQDRGQHFADQFESNLYPNYEALLADQPDGVVICSENAHHRPLVEMAADAGVHILSEKPLATSLEDAQAMTDTCARAGVKLMTAYPMRFSTPMVEIKALIERGELGRIYTCSTSNQGALPRHHREWFVEKELAGGGAIMDHTVHLADLLRWFLDSEVVEVYAQTNHIFHADSVDVETGGLLMLTFENGIFASIDCSWSRPKNWPTWGGLEMKLVAENGVVGVDAFRQNLVVYGQQSAHPTWAYWGSDANQAMIEEFVDAIRENRQPIVTGFDGYKSLEVALAAYQSAESGQPVKLPLQ